jgi:hypothetical protein
MTDMNEAILKAGRRGHLRQTPVQKQALVEACEASGHSSRVSPRRTGSIARPWFPVLRRVGTVSREWSQTRFLI